MLIRVHILGWGNGGNRSLLDREIYIINRNLKGSGRIKYLIFQTNV